jgi:hypothetical protein
LRLKQSHIYDLFVLRNFLRYLSRDLCAPFAWYERSNLIVRGSGDAGELSPIIWSFPENPKAQNRLLILIRIHIINFWLVMTGKLVHWAGPVTHICDVDLYDVHLTFLRSWYLPAV